MNKPLPEVRIQFSQLIYNKIAKPMFRLMQPDKSLISKEKSEDIASEYISTWKPKEEKILTGLMDAYNLEFYKTTLDVYLCPRVPTFSTPTVISMREEPDRFIDILTHELCHVLISDNKTLNRDQYFQVINKLYPDEERTVYNHILIHAGLKYVFEDVLQEPERTKRDIEAVDHNPPYKRAWEIVEQKGYKNILNDFKQAIAGLT